MADILTAIIEIRSYLDGISAQQFALDSKTRSAVERQLLTISEACARLVTLDDSVEARYPDVPWRKAIGMGNILRHEYGRVDSQVVWETVKPGGPLADLEQAILAVKSEQQSR